MSSPSTNNSKSLRLVAAVMDRLAADAAAQVNVSAFVRAVTHAFIASGAAIEDTRALGVRLNSKTSDTILRVTLPPAIQAHFARYAKAAGNHSLGALVSSALAAHYFGAAPAPAQPVTPAAVAEGGYRDLLTGLVAGQTIELTRRDLPTTLARARKALFATADAVRDTLASLRISTRLTPRVLYVTRVS